MGKFASITARKIIAALLKEGFILDRQAGSHQIYRHPNGRRVTVSFHHPSDTFPPKTLKSMLFQADWNELDLKRLKIIK